MEDSQVLRNSHTNAQIAEDRTAMVDPKSSQPGPQNAAFCTSRLKAVFMSPTDNFFSPCTRKLASRRGPRHPSLQALSQRQLGKVLQNESSQQETNENTYKGLTETK